MCVIALVYFNVSKLLLANSWYGLRAARIPVRNAAKLPTSYADNTPRRE